MENSFVQSVAATVISAFLIRIPARIRRMFRRKPRAEHSVRLTPTSDGGTRVTVLNTGRVPFVIVSAKVFCSAFDDGSLTSKSVTVAPGGHADFDSPCPIRDTRDVLLDLE